MKKGIFTTLFIVYMLCNVPFAFAWAKPSYSPQAKEYIERAKKKLLEQKEKKDAQKSAEQKWLGGTEATLAAGEEPLAEKLPATVEYFIAAGDQMEIFVWQNPDLSKDVIVGPDGKISYPLVGRIQAAGLTIGRLEEEIREKLAKFVQYPEVSIMMKKFIGDKVIVLGEVNSPGIHTYEGQIDVVKAIALAGDFTDDARGDSVMIVRGSLAANPQVRRVDALGVLSKGAPGENFVLRPNDIVYVPRSYIANFNKFVTHINPLVSTALSVLDLRTEIRRLQEHTR